MVVAIIKALVVRFGQRMRVVMWATVGIWFGIAFSYENEHNTTCVGFLGKSEDEQQTQQIPLPPFPINACMGILVLLR